VILVVTVNGWWTDYKSQTPKKTAETSATAEATETPAPAPTQTVLILTDGLNFREKPDATGATIRGLKKGEKFVLVSKSGSWLQLQDASGQAGWVNNNPQYVKIEK
jgi:uncharacterized protein YgiM (DUF1202 family)